MTLFVKKVIKFLFPLLLYFFIIWGVNTLIISNLKNDLFSKEIKKSKLITGDSHMRQSLDTLIIRNSINIAQPGEPYFLSYWKLREIYPKIRPDTLILGYSYHNLSSYYELKFTQESWRNEVLTRSYLLADFQEIYEVTNIKKMSIYSFYFHKMILYPHKESLAYIGKYKPLIGEDLLQWEKSVQKHFYEGDKVVEVSQLSHTYLNAIVDFCERKKIKLILVGTPLYKKYYENIPQVFKDAYSSLSQKIKKRGVSVFDRTNISYPDSLFLNADHLNKIGAERFSKELKKIINKDSQ